MPLRTKYIPESKRKEDNLKRWELTAVHEEKGMKLIKQMVKIFQPEIILELGTSWGGLTGVLHDAMPNIDLFTYDKKSRTRRPHEFIEKNPKIHVCFCDLLTKPYDRLLLKLEEDKKKLLYCDNGNKIKEVLMYGSKLKIGDMLGIHDWGNEFNFDWEKLDTHHRERNTPEEVKKVKDLLTNDFEPYHHDVFIKNNCSTRLWIRRK